MNILVTGAHGFIGKNLVEALKQMKHSSEILLCDKHTDEYQLDKYCSEADFVFHLAGINRTENASDFAEVNVGFTEKLLTLLKKHQNKAPILMSSSIQADLMNPYGISKRAAEELIKAYGKTENVKTYIYRLPNVFGKWCKPNYNSVVATFCHHIARNLPIRVSNPHQYLQLVYIDDVISAFISKLNNQSMSSCNISPIYNVTLQEIAANLFSFKKSRNSFYLPEQSSGFTKKLYATYLSYLPEKEFAYPLIAHSDNRGSFCEVLKTDNNGQISVNFVKPGQTKGNHWHHTKTEKFLAVAGKGEIILRKIGTDDIITYELNCEKHEIIDIPPGYTHAVKNTGTIDFVTVIWASEVYDASNPDTFYEEV